MPSLNNISAIYSITVDPPEAEARTFVADWYGRTQDTTPKPCLYIGNSQGGGLELVGSSVIEGEYFEYEVTDGIFGSEFIYNRLEMRSCESLQAQ